MDTRVEETEETESIDFEVFAEVFWVAFEDGDPYFNADSSITDRNVQSRGTNNLIRSISDRTASFTTSEVESIFRI
jgi:hypothetical protein